jgi:hypothetical protein
MTLTAYPLRGLLLLLARRLDDTSSQLLLLLPAAAAVFINVMRQSLSGSGVVRAALTDCRTEASAIHPKQKHLHIVARASVIDCSVYHF